MGILRVCTPPVAQIFDDIFSKAGKSPNGMRRKSLDPEEIDR
jgi:hypothetical protein